MRYRLVKYRGKFCVAWTDGGTTVRRSLRTDNRDVAEARYRIALAELQRPASSTVADIWEACRKDKEAQGKTSATAMPYHWKALEQHFGSMDSTRISVEDCRSYTAKRRAAGRAPSTIATELKYLRLAVNWAEKHGLIHKAPFIEVPPESPARNRHLTKAEMRILLDCAASPHIRLAMELLLATAGRIAAVLELTWDRVDFERGKITLKTSEAGKGRAIVAMTDRIRDVLLASYEERTCDSVVEYGGGPVKSVRKGIANAADRAGLAGVTPHVFRHTAAVWLAESGVSMEEIAQFLGHRDVQVTREVYARYSPEHLRKAAKALEF